MGTGLHTSRVLSTWAEQVLGEQGPRCGGLLWVKPTSGKDKTQDQVTPPPHCFCRNLRKGPSGLADEINFEDFLTIMSYFRPIDTSLGEEQVELSRKEKLRCACPLARAPWPLSPQPHTGYGCPRPQNAGPARTARGETRNTGWDPWRPVPRKVVLVLFVAK